MMPITELVALDAASPPPVAMQLADQWGWTELEHFRSSDNHVFRGSGPTGLAFLRFAPQWHRDVAENSRIARIARALAAAGAGVTTPIPTIRGEDVAITVCGATTYSGSSWTQLTGDILETDDLTAETAAEWGRALGRFHTANPELPDAERGAPQLVDELRSAADDGQVPGSIRDHAARLVDLLCQLPHDAGVTGMIHGDPELDNLCWLAAPASEPMWMDLDHFAHGWFAADICFALRDLAPAVEPPDPQHPLVAGFLRGYGEVRPVSPDEHEWWPRFAAAHAVLTVVSVAHASGSVDPSWPEWAVGLQRRFDEIIVQTQNRLAAISPQL